MRKNESGFSLVETMVGLVILLIGLTGLAGTIVMSTLRTRQQEQQLLAKQYATSTLEAIMSARDIGASGLEGGWNAIGNVGNNVVAGTARGIFVNGKVTLKTGAGPDQVVGTADDNGTTVKEFVREIIITDQCDPDRPSPGCNPSGTNPIAMRRVTVKVYYTIGNAQLSETLDTTLTNY